MKPYNKRRISSYLLTIILVIIGINWLSDQFFFRLDFTADKRYTLSKATRDIITHLPGNITITAYFTNDLPPDIAKVKKDFKELLVEYYQISKGKIVFNFIDPAEKPEAEQEAMSSGIQPAIINVREKDQVKQQKVFLGAKISMNEQTDVIPLIQPGAAMEYALSSGIKKVSVTNKPVVGFIQGQGEPPLGALQQLNEALSVLYNVEAVNLTDSIYKLSEYPTIVDIAPSDSISPARLAQYDRFLNDGGKLVLALNGVKGDFNSLQGTAANTNFRPWLEKRGILLGKKFVIDAQCANIGVTQQNGGFTFQSQIPFPYLPLIKQFKDHSITKGLEQVVLQFPTNLTIKPVAGITAEVIAETSSSSGLLDAPVTFDINKQWTDRDFTAPSQAVAAVVEGKPWKMVVIADGNFATNGSGQNAQKVQPDNISLLANSVDWLTDQTGLMDLRTKQVTGRPLDQVSESRKIFIKYLNFLLPLILVIGYGLFRMQRNRNTRMRRMIQGMI